MIKENCLCGALAVSNNSETAVIEAENPLKGFERKPF